MFFSADKYNATKGTPSTITIGDVKIGVSGTATTMIVNKENLQYFFYART
ncbi:hypothetical protein FACS1894166_02270 [Bacilli bacterium]|nr:hypothetical protein FACS1894166_02270 [Bacilli bacterium]